ncbi:lateral signaling target protein 2 homolog isoform X2 [Leptopilina heterotoma]|uniref:lateral signaling target protein 2 homolog isoform X2 n=1 Tax=Leptopilina heterotoma TaxID=63436 RepID=UPI001CA7E3A6|nr:lateral signaling target protein 2 homolog isoform X2 [Leptopilina heterotoma]
MTVMPSSSDVADKAVSTEDASCGVEVASIDALLAALVETKVEAIKASSSSIITRRFGSAPASPRRPRLTSSSTVSSSQNHHHHHHYHHCHPDHRHHHQHHHCDQHHHHCDHLDHTDDYHYPEHVDYHQRQNYQEEEQHREHHHHHHHRHGRRYEKKKRERHRRHGSAPCGEFIENPRLLERGSDKGKRRASECPRSPSKKRKYSKGSYVLEEDILDLPLGLDTPFENLGIDGDQDLGLINLIRSREAFSDICEYPRLHQSACYTSQNEAQLKLDYDEDDDFLALNLEDELDDNETLSNPEKVNKPMEQFHRPRKKRKRRRRQKKIEPEIVIETDPDELPPRARMTIVATACLLLAMSLLLVGITLRMGPIIDEMVSSKTEPESSFEDGNLIKASLGNDQ